MRSAAVFVAVVAGAAPMSAACVGDALVSGSVLDGGAGGAGGQGLGGSGGAGGVACLGDPGCSGGVCLPLGPAGLLVCARPPDEAQGCYTTFDQCCTTVDCPPGAQCFATPVVPSCAGVAGAPYNECASDQCVGDGECGGGAVCVPAGALGFDVRACMAAACVSDGDCVDEPGGRCDVVAEPCCGVPAGLFCVFPKTGCRSNADCPGGYCATDGRRAFCSVGGPACPL